MASPAPAAPPCQMCGTTAQGRVTCVQCNNLSFCDACWPQWMLHLPGSVGWGGRPHEKADPAVLHRLRCVLEPERTEAEHAAELAEDQDTTWFGFDRDAQGHPLLHDYGRFAAIMAEAQDATLDDDAPERYPRLVSFVGETGAGKSTLIKILIDRQDLTPTAEGSKYYTPVTSSNYDRIPTTGNVHLYADPSTLYGSTPLLLADCEGLNGGESMPKQLRRLSEDLLQPGPSTSSAPLTHGSRHGKARKMTWADTPQTRKREYAVAQLYPRILYTFSDVVVFVLRNPRVFESTVLGKLLRWGADSVDKSLNQPVLPHAIIVLNASDGHIDDGEWDVTTATNLLMHDIKGATMREPAVLEYVKNWRKVGREITTTQQLLECYYASVRVIRIPDKTSYMRMDQQAGRLFELIKNRCEASHLRKKKVRMLANTEKLQVHLQAAYDHFTQHLDVPFDFVKEVLRRNPASPCLEANILHVALLIKERSRHASVHQDAERIFWIMAPMIASCVIFDAVRRNILGSTTRILDDRYAAPCTRALERFADMHWPCRFTSPAFEGDLGRCCNVKSGHDPKGHQNKQGIIIGQGAYESDFDAARYGPAWCELIRTNLQQLQAASFKLGLELATRSEMQLSALLHRERINELYSNTLGPATDFVSHSACLCCLGSMPECALPCGHVLCLSCIETYATRTSRTTVEMTRCPLHVGDIIATPPWVITTKPALAGARVLCLDGGGVRGIVQLQVLRKMERMLGPGLPIRLFFDLIVGTNTGGLLALGLGARQWTVKETMEKFKDLCKDAFTPREMTGVPLFGPLSSLYHGSLYKTKPFTRTLRDFFSDQLLFGGTGPTPRRHASTKVAVTGMTTADKKSVVFANYNRSDASGQGLAYRFMRSDGPEKELKAWEAARATSATPPFFKPFLHTETETEYRDASMHHTCPIWIADGEAKSIWGDAADSPLDIVLSIGAGKNVGEGPESSSSQSSSSIVTGTSFPDGRASTIFKQIRGGAGKLRRPDLYASPEQPEKTWAQFMASEAGVGHGRSHKQPYLRLCPEYLTELPRFDMVQKMDELEHEAGLGMSLKTTALTEVVHRLVASTFFWETGAVSVKPGGSESVLACTGAVFCRFGQSSPEMKALGGYLLARLTPEFAPYFVVESQGQAGQPAHQQMVLGADALRNMHLHGHFEMEPVRMEAVAETAQVAISLCLQTWPYRSGVSVVPISGFPRRLMGSAGAGAGHDSPTPPAVLRMQSPAE